MLGVQIDTAVLWIVGAHLEIVGVAVGTIARVAWLLSRPWTAGKPSGIRRELARGIPGIFALILFGLAWWVRGDTSIPPDPAVLLAEALAAALLVAGEWIERRAPDAPGPAAQF